MSNGGCGQSDSGTILVNVSGNVLNHHHHNPDDSLYPSNSGGHVSTVPCILLDHNDHRNLYFAAQQPSLSNVHGSTGSSTSTSTSPSKLCSMVMPQHHSVNSTAQQPSQMLSYELTTLSSSSSSTLEPGPGLTTTTLPVATSSSHHHHPPTKAKVRFCE